MNPGELKDLTDPSRLYEKSQSFGDMHGFSGDPGKVRERLRLLRGSPELSSFHGKALVMKAIDDVLEGRESTAEAPYFTLHPNIVDEMTRLEDAELPRYLHYRYRYDIYPKIHHVDDFPPLIQIEPASICNLRCIFCYQTDPGLTDKQEGHMGRMSFEMFKNIVDAAEGRCEALTLASRGEPTVCRELPQMLDYLRGKFLAVKVNTNATLLTEKLCHAFLESGIQTLVFSADAAEKELYAQLRVGAKLENVLANVRRFRDIREKHYPKSRMITRVSGVRVNRSQSMDSMLACWGELVDQIAFVNYNPWENTYERPVNDERRPCSDLWRRMFVWWDGRVNPCDVDYRSKLVCGDFPERDLGELWTGEAYDTLRQTHLKAARMRLHPCDRCTVV